jgi:hypothetical protein
MRVYRDFLPNAPGKLCPFLGIKTVPSCAPFPEEIWGERICALISCFNGSQPMARRRCGRCATRCLRRSSTGWGRCRSGLQALFDPLLPKGLQWYWSGDFVDSLSDAAIERIIAHASQSPSELSLMHLYPIDGAVQDVPADATAWGARDMRWSMVIAGIDPDPAKAPALKAWVKDYWAAVHPLNGHGGGYVNFMMADEGNARVRASYGPNHARLVAVKRKYDPGNLFRVNQNIDPAAAA